MYIYKGQNQGRLYKYFDFWGYRRYKVGHKLKVYSAKRTELKGVPNLKATPLHLKHSSALLGATKGVDVIVSAIGGAQSNRYEGISSLIQEAYQNRVLFLGCFLRKSVMD